MSINASIANATAGSVLFAGTSGVLQQDNSNFFWDDANNWLGIGTDAPDTKLNVVETTAETFASTFQFSSVSSTTPRGIAVQNNDQSANSVGGINFQLTRNDGTIHGAGFVAVGKEQLWTSTSNTRDSYMSFHTVLNGNFAEYMRITSAGNVGIGSTAPGRRLSVATSSAALQLAVLRSVASGNLGNTANAGTIAFGAADSSTFAERVGATINAIAAETYSSTAYGTHLTFATTPVTTTTPVERVRIDSQGNVGIGDTTPDALLDVAGTFRADGIATFGAQVRLKGYTVATLPAGTQGDTAFVTDALAPAFLTALVGGGAVVTPAFYDGTNWVAI